MSSNLIRKIGFGMFVIAMMANTYSVYAQIQLDSMLTACFPFSGNANDLSGNNNNGIVNGATLTVDRFGTANSAYHFDGNNAYIEVPNFNLLVPNDEVSISFWCKVDAFGSHSQFQLQPDDASDRFNISIHYDHNGVPSTFWDYGSIFSGGRLQVINTPFVSQWEHYVLISSASQNIMQEYKNGVLVVSENHHSSIVNKMRSLWIGKGSNLFGMEGDIDDLRFYSRVISSAEIQALFVSNVPCSVPCLTSLDSLLTGCYPFNSNANDFSGFNNHGTVTGATLTSDRFGNPNSAFHFNGSGSYILVPDFSSLVPTDELSVSFWCRIDGGISAHSQFQLQPDINTDRFNISVHYSHNGIPSTFWDYGNILSDGRVITLNVPFVSEWEHYVFISSASQNLMQEYRNGVLVKSENHQSSIVDKQRELWIGGGSTLNTINGDMDDIRFYNRVLDVNEVMSLYTYDITCIDPCNVSTSVPDEWSAETVSIYPNPSYGNFTISFDQPVKNTMIRIFDSLGRIVFIEQISNESLIQKVIDVTSPGIYLVEVINSQKSYVQKLIIY